MDELKKTTIEELVNAPVILNKTEIELLALVKEYEGVSIQGIDDKGGLELAKKAKKILGETRRDISEFRLNATKGIRELEKRMIAEERRLIGIISPIEDRLKAEIDEINEEKARLKRVALLPQRQEELKKLEVELTDDYVLSLDDKAYQELLNQSLAAFNQKLLDRQKELEERQQAIRQQVIDAKIASRRDSLHAASAYLDENSIANLSDIEFDNFIANWIELRKKADAKEAAEKKKAEEEAYAAKVKDLEERQRQAEKDALDKIEKDRLAKEQAEEAAAIKKEQDEKRKQEELKKNKAVQDFLAKYAKEIKDNNYVLEQKSDSITLYKIIDKIEV